MEYRPNTKPYPSDFASPPGHAAPLRRSATSAMPTVSAGGSSELAPTKSAVTTFATALSVLSCGLSLAFWCGGEHLLALFQALAEWLWAAPVGPPHYGALPGKYLPAAYLAMICVAVVSSATAAGGLWLSRRRDDRLTRAVVGVSLVSSAPALLLALFVLVDHEHSPLRWLGW